MNAYEYTVLARKTDRDLGSPLKNIAHASLGMISEVGELADMLKRNLAYGKEFDKINLIEECGDVLWYVVKLCEHAEMSFVELMPQAKYATDPIDMMVEDLAQYIGIVATRARQCQMNGMRLLFSPEIRRILTTIDKICRAAGYTIEEAMRRNIAKLATRYPEGFSEFRALNRDLFAEREVLEGAQPQL